MRLLWGLAGSVRGLQANHDLRASFVGEASTPRRLFPGKVDHQVLAYPACPQWFSIHRFALPTKYGGISLCEQGSLVRLSHGFFLTEKQCVTASQGWLRPIPACGGRARGLAAEYVSLLHTPQLLADIRMYENRNKSDGHFVYLALFQSALDLYFLYFINVSTGVFAHF